MKVTIKEQEKLAFDAMYRWSTLRLIGAKHSPHGLVTPVRLEEALFCIPMEP